MKIIIHDVGNAACSIISSPNNYGMMIDCGSHSEKENPIAHYNRPKIKSWLKLRDFRSFPLALLHITHPDDDHVRNAKRIKAEFPPCLLRRRIYEEFPDRNTINIDYIEDIDKHYRGDTQFVDWGFNYNETFHIPMETIKTDEELSKKIRNNSSIIRLIKHNGISILYCGDMESAGWNWLVKYNSNFRKAVAGGIDILVAPHHGHKSGFPTALFELTGNVMCVIHSKGSEGNTDGTDVSSQYSNYANGIRYMPLEGKAVYKGKVLTTRSNGNIYINITENGFKVHTSKASPNHSKV